jgi:hypothetical protein
MAAVMYHSFRIRDFEWLGWCFATHAMTHLSSVLNGFFVEKLDNYFQTIEQMSAQECFAGYFRNTARAFSSPESDDVIIRERKESRISLFVNMTSLKDLASIAGCITHATVHLYQTAWPVLQHYYHTAMSSSKSCPYAMVGGQSSIFPGLTAGAKILTY